eukprot:scaffold200478_cov18-Tisochrysis_lutea.AAC.1
MRICCKTGALHDRVPGSKREWASLACLLAQRHRVWLLRMGESVVVAQVLKRFLWLACLEPMLGLMPPLLDARIKHHCIEWRCSTALWVRGDVR